MTTMYSTINFQTKKALKDAVAAGKEVGVYCPGLGTAPTNGKAFLEGPHYPQPHKWYAEVEVKDGKIVKVK